VIHSPPSADIATIPSGLYRLGSDDHYREEAPVRSVAVARFGIETHLVTNAEFERFVSATGWVTACERSTPAGSAVFAMTDGPVDLRRPDLWWRFVEGACWKHPTGPESDLSGKADHPVVHVTLEDALAYAAWAGRRLPSETEWETAARGGLPDQPYAWGPELDPAGLPMAHIWRGAFPWWTADDETPGPRPVGSYPANGYGLFDMIGNVWEWTADPFVAPGRTGGCGCSNAEASADFRQTTAPATDPPPASV
jgi:sulfatase modifying factor 1